jgi:hypothetical protein
LRLSLGWLGMCSVVLVGQRSYCSICPPPGAPAVAYRAGADPAALLLALRQTQPDVVVVFEPETVPAGVFDGLEAVTVGFNTEAVPRGGEATLEELAALGGLARTDVGQFDRIVTLDPLAAQAARSAGTEVWRSMPLPVADEFFVDGVAPQHDPARVLFLGYATGHREDWLTDAKHAFDLLHVAHGLHGEALRRVFDRTDVAINLHDDPHASFEAQVPLHLAAGHLVLSEPLCPTHGLEPGLDYVEITSPEALKEAIASLREFPGVWDAVRRRGRRKAEQFRASRVWPRMLADLERDLNAFGTRRRGRTAASPRAA